MRPYLIDEFSDSVRFPSPDHPLLQALAGLPTAPGVRFASVIGVVGGWGCLQQAACVANNGVVPADSAQLGFGTEFIVGGGHDGHSDPAAIAFMRGELLDWAADR